jgi:DnaJ-class molecular chaperone
MDFKQIEEARKILGLDEEASAQEIRKIFRDLVLKYHPDRCKEKDKKQNEEMIKKINHAKDIIEIYCANYRYSFKEKEVRKNTMSREEYEHLKRFYDGWLGNADL